MKVRTTSFSLIFSLNNLWIQIVYSTANIIKRIKIMIRSTTKRSTIITKRSILSTIRMMTQRLKLKFQMLRTLCYLQTPRLSHSTIVLLLNSQQLRTIRRSKKSYLQPQMPPSKSLKIFLLLTSLQNWIKACQIIWIQSNSNQFLWTTILPKSKIKWHILLSQNQTPVMGTLPQNHSCFSQKQLNRKRLLRLHWNLVFKKGPLISLGPRS